jgi:hypothetical protein
MVLPEPEPPPLLAKRLDAIKAPIRPIIGESAGKRLPYCLVSFRPDSVSESNRPITGRSSLSGRRLSYCLVSFRPDSVSESNRPIIGESPIHGSRLVLP